MRKILLILSLSMATSAHATQALESNTLSPGLIKLSKKVKNLGEFIEGVSPVLNLETRTFLKQNISGSESMAIRLVKKSANSLAINVSNHTILVYKLNREDGQFTYEINHKN